MDETQINLHCSRKDCQTANPMTREFCGQCQAPLIKRYLWVVGDSLNSKLINQLLANRYFVVSKNLVLETKPATPPDFPETIPYWLKPYLKLSPYRLHIPKVYGSIALDQGIIWLLEYENFSSTVQAKLAQGEFLPPLSAVWKKATGTRQINWLLQISQLWQPLQSQKVAQTLITPELLRVNGSIIQLQELHSNQDSVLLKDLGKLWSSWIEDSEPSIQSFLQEVCQNLIEGKLESSEGLTRFLDEGLTEIARSRSRSYQVATVTDSGPTRSHNEDAYYQQEESQTSGLNQQALAIVCDGVGGHQGGEIASKLAIDHLRQNLKTIQENPSTPRLFTHKIEKAVSEVNDVICEQNDQEKRRAQERMGTTLVMALAHNHEMYITHVGDSRVYWITVNGCYQLTLDDDLASRQTRLGHLFYREALQQPSAGALVQALGMSSSKLLHPNTQRLVIEEDCVFLLCSDGLSDNGLVEQYWEQEILPILEAQKDVNIVAQRLVSLANTLNGHDNVTVSLMKCSISTAEEKNLTVTFKEQTEIQPEPETVLVPEQLDKPKTSKRGGLGLLILILVLLISGVSFSYWYFPQVRQGLNQFRENLKQKPMRDPSELPSP